MSDYELSAAWYARRIVERSGLLQREVAARLAISDAYLSDVLNGRRRVTPELANALVEKIETTDRDAARRDIHLLGAEQDGWVVR